MKYRKRYLETVLKESISLFSCIALTGPRQSGKSTLLKHIFPEYRYVTFDDLSIRALFQDDPKAFMIAYNDKVIFDEIQKVPEIFEYLKIEIDRDRSNKGKFIVTGSSQLTLMSQVTESLAGRIGLFTLLPFQYSEMAVEFQKNSCYMGSYPELSEWGYKNTERWFDSYISTYLEKDVRGLNNVGNLQDFRRLLQLLAGLTGQELNLSTLANQVSVSVPTIKNWVSILEASYILFLLPSYHKNFGKRITKRPKIHFYDMGLVSALTGISTFEQYDKGPLSGSMYESFLISEIVKNAFHRDTRERFYYLRTNNGQEIDLIIEKNSQLEFVEIKKNKTFKPSMLKSIKSFLDDSGTGTLLYSGETISYLEKLQVRNSDSFLRDL